MKAVLESVFHGNKEITPANETTSTDADLRRGLFSINSKPICLVNIEVELSASMDKPLNNFTGRHPATRYRLDITRTG